MEGLAPRAPPLLRSRPPDGLATLDRSFGMGESISDDVAAKLPLLIALKAVEELRRRLAVKLVEATLKLGR